MGTETRLDWSPASMLRQGLLGMGFVLLYVLLDWVSYIRPLQGFNITPWSPQPALAIAWLIWQPRRWGPVLLGLLSAEVVVRGVPGNWWAVAMAAMALTGLYVAMARILTGQGNEAPAPESLRELGRFTLVVAGGAFLCGASYVIIYAAPSLGTAAVVIEAVVRYWIGDVVGYLVSLPLLLILLEPARRQALGAALRQPRWLLVLAVIAGLIWAVLGLGGSTGPRFFYLLFIPVVLAATARGMQGAVLAASLTQLGLIVAVQTHLPPDITVFELQALMATMTMTGLLVGVLVDEQARTAEALRDTMRLATAGRLTATLAHELSQPLTALSNYAQAAQMLAADEALASAQRREQLVVVTQRMVTDARRTAEVVRRLRDFFGTGAVRLEPVCVADVVEEAVAGQRQRAQLLGVALVVRLTEGLPTVWADALQVDIVLRNLLDNALHAAAQVENGGVRQVELRVGVQAGMMLFEVLDSGAGLTTQRLARIWEPGASDKPGGMGMGLGICRAIVEAHGGKLEAKAAQGGYFCFTLALEERAQPKEHDAQEYCLHH